MGSEEATKWYVEQALRAGVGFINAIPVFIGREPYWQRRFAEEGLPVIGDDIKSQVGATITHRVLTRLFMDRGVRIDRTYQLNFGGNTDFLNMLERERLESKKISKTNAVTSMLDYELADEDIHVGPSDYVPWLKDRKWCHIRIEGTTFGDVPLNAELKLEVWDSPNSAGVITDAIRCLKLGLDRGLKGTLVAPSSYFMKSPPIQIHDDIAYNRVEAFIRGDDNETLVGNEESAATSKALASGAREAPSPRPPPRRDGPRTRTSRRPTGASAGPSRLIERTAVVAYRAAAAVFAHIPPGAHPAVVAAVLQGGYLLWPTKRRWSNANFGHVLGLPPGGSAGALASRSARTARMRATSSSCMRLPSRAAKDVDALEMRRGRRGRRGLASARRADDRRRSPTSATTRRVAAAIADRGYPVSVVADDTAFPELFELLRAQRKSWGVDLIPWRNLRGIYDVLQARRDPRACSSTGAIARDGVPVRLFDAWTTLPGRSGHAGREDRRARSSRCASSARRTAASASRPMRRSASSSSEPCRHPARDAGHRGLRSSGPSRRRRSSGTASSRCGRWRPASRRSSRSGRPRCSRAWAGGAARGAAARPGTWHHRSRRRRWSPARARPRHERVPGGAHRRRLRPSPARSRSGRWSRSRRQPARSGIGSRHPARLALGGTSGASPSGLAREGRGSALARRAATDPDALERLVRRSLPPRRPLLPRGRPHPDAHPRRRHPPR